MSITHQLWALLVTFIWGTNFVFIKIGLEEFPPFLLATLRFTLVAFPLILFMPRPKLQWSVLASYGVLIGFGQFGLLFWAMQSNISPGLASLVVQVQVFFTIFIAYLIFNESITKVQIIALLVCAFGLMIIAVANSTDSQYPTTWLGLITVLVAALSWACGNIIVKKHQPKDMISFIVWTSLFTIPPLALMSVYFEGLDVIQTSLYEATWVGWSVIVWQTIGNTLIGYGLWNVLLKHYPAAMITPWALLVPVFGISASFMVLDEELPAWKIVAAGLIIGGLVINALGGRRL